MQIFFSDNFQGIDFDGRRYDIESSLSDNGENFWPVLYLLAF